MAASMLTKLRQEVASLQLRLKDREAVLDKVRIVVAQNTELIKMIRQLTQDLEKERSRNVYLEWLFGVVHAAVRPAVRARAGMDAIGDQ